jgi:Dicarboxylate carrier protein MatC N-terminus
VSVAALSLLALLVALALSMTTRINVGWLALACAWLIGVYGAGMRPDAVMAGFPATLFLTLVGVTLLFSIAETSGDARVVPALVFLVACTISLAGPGSVSTVALLAPLAMSMGERVGVVPLVTALMVANGANAGNLSPFSSVGVIANGAMARAGLGGYEGHVWFANFAAHVAVSAAVYAWYLRSRSRRSAAAARTPVAGPEPPASFVGTEATGSFPARSAPSPSASLTGPQRLTVALIALWIAGVIGLESSLGLSAVAASVALLAFNAADEGAAVRRMPWGIIMMVSGVSVLIALLEKTGGMDLFTALLARIASPQSLNGVIAFVTGAISTYSSTSGVVLPAFLPTVPKLVEQVGGGDPLAVALSINVGSSLVDVSPLSTLGALCLATVADPQASRQLFRALLLWGLSMTLVGAVLCQLFAGWVASV